MQNKNSRIEELEREIKNVSLEIETLNSTQSAYKTLLNSMNT